VTADKQKENVNETNNCVKSTSNANDNNQGLNKEFSKKKPTDSTPAPPPPSDHQNQSKQRPLSLNTTGEKKSSIVILFLEKPKKEQQSQFINFKIESSQPKSLSSQIKASQATTSDVTINDSPNE
jgi:hypothetical protein